MTYIFSKISTEGKLPNNPVRAAIIASCLMDWGCISAGAEIPENFGKGMAAAGAFLGFAVTPERLSEEAGKFLNGKITELTEDQFDSLIPLIKNHLDNNASFDGCMFETYGEEVEYVQKIDKETPNRVITILDGDDGTYYSSGYHRINRIGYLIAEKPFDFEFEMKLDTFE